MGDKEKNFMSAVIYVHNAEREIVNFLQCIIEVCTDNFECFEIICVNDDSIDSSVELIKKVGKSVNSSISILNMSYFHGVEMAMNAGVDLAIGDFVFEFDSTILDFTPTKIMEVYFRALGGYDIVSACPDRREKISSKLFYRIFDHFSNYPSKMSTESFRILSRRAINRIKSMNRTIPYRKAIYAGCGLKTDCIQYKVKDIITNTDEMERRYRTDLAIDVLILFTDVGYQFSKVMTMMMMVISIFMMVYSAIVYLMASPVEGWTTTILFLAVAFGGLFGILTVIVKYLQLLVDLVFKKKHYSFESIEKLTS